MDAKEKIERLLLHLGVNPKVFAERLGYERPQIIYDILKGRTKRISDELAARIMELCPDISKSWLLADEGDMIKAGVSQTTHGDNSPNISGNGNSVNISLDKAIDEIAEQRKLVAKSQEQIDRLLMIIEKMQGI